jgi:hypothetical protein
MARCIKVFMAFYSYIGKIPSMENLGPVMTQYKAKVGPFLGQMALLMCKPSWSQPRQLIVSA